MARGGVGVVRRRGIGFRVAPVEIESRDDAKIWIILNQFGRRNLSDDQKAMIADSARERRSKLRMAERAGNAGSVGGVGRPKQNSLSDNVSDIEKPKRDTRAEVARENKVPERKLRAAAI